MFSIACLFLFDFRREIFQRRIHGVPEAITQMDPLELRFSQRKMRNVTGRYQPLAYLATFGNSYAHLHSRTRDNTESVLLLKPWADNSGFCWWQAHCRFSEAGEVWRSTAKFSFLRMCAWKFLRISARGILWKSRVIWTWLHSLGAPNSTNRRGAKHLWSTLSFASQWFSRENHWVYAWGFVMVSWCFMMHA